MKKYLFLILIVFLFSISAVSAEEINNGTNVMENSHDSELIAESVDGNDLLTETGTFSELQDLINKVDSDAVINLTKDYVAESGGRISFSKEVNLTINGNGHTLDANGKSGIFHITGGCLILNNLTLKNGNGDNGGALTIHENARSLILDHVKFLNNRAEDSGGAIYYDSPNASVVTRLTDCYFEGNSAKLFGGAIYYNSVKDMSINNCIFKSNRCEGGSAAQGGAIFSRNKMNITGCAFIDNFGFEDGGAIYSTKYLYITNCNFTNNKVNLDYGGVISVHNGGAIYSQDKLDIINCTFNNSLAKTHGGAIYSKQSINIINCNFTNNNVTTDDGGAIYCLDNVNIENSIFKNNHGYIHGGAIYSGKSVDAKDSRFEKNSLIDTYGPEQRTGGTIKARENVKVVNSYFSDSSALDSGGAIHAGSVTVVSSYFVSNRANRNGGAVYAANNVEVENSYFQSNYARRYGGAIYSEQSVSTKNTTFESNHLDDIPEYYSNGGAIYAEYNVKVDNSSFFNNAAADLGGAIYSDSVTWVASPSYFIGNHVINTKQGGAIYTNNFTDRYVKYGVFIENGVGSKDCQYGEGGAIYLNKESHITFSQCVFQNNYAKKGSAIYLDSRSSWLAVTDNIFIADGSYQQQPVYNYGWYSAIRNNWYRSSNPDFENMFIEWGLFSDDSHADGDYLVTELTLSETPRVGQTYNVTFKFKSVTSVQPTEGLFGWNAKFNADNGATISNYKIGTNTVTAEITFNNAGVTNVNVDVFGEILKLSFNPTKENVTMDIDAPEIFWGEDATAEINFTPNTATGTVTVGGISATIVNGTATVIIPNLTVGNNTLPVEYSGDGVFKNMSTSVVIVVNRKDLNINASAIPIHSGDNATVVVSGLENATGNVTVSINGNNWSGEITEGVCNVIVPGLTENATATVTYQGNTNYNNASTTVNIIVNTDNKKNLDNMVASVEPINIPNNATVVVSGLENATGNVNVVIGDKNWSGEISEGVATVIVTGLTGNVTANVSYAGDYKYENASTTVNITVYPPITVWYVDGSRSSSGDGKSESTAFKTLKEAINNAPDGSTIYIMPSTYVGDDNVGLTINKNLNLEKLGDGEVILDAQGLKRILNVNAQSLNITGITFKNGKDEHGGGAIAFNSDLNNSIIDSIFINNSANYGDGGAIYFNGNLNNVTLKGTYNNNSAEDGGVFYLYGNMTDVDISGNYADNVADEGAVIFCEGDIANSTIYGNYNNNHAITGINVILVGYNVDISGNYVNNTVENGGVLYIMYCDDKSIIHDSIFINNDVGDEPIITVLIESISALNNWFGNNATNYNITPNVSQNLTLINWLFLNATTNATELKLNDAVEIIFKLYSYNSTSEEIAEYDASKMNIKLNLTQIGGTLNKDSALINETVIYTFNEGEIASVTGRFENASYTLILAKASTEIIINKTEITLLVDQSVSAEATLKPEVAGNLTYTSSDSTIAIVENGKIIGLKEGNVTITVSFEGNEYYTAAENKTIKVTVLKDASVSVNNDTIALSVGENFTIVATTSPEGLNVTYVVDDSGVVSVDENGVVTALKVGTATIVVKVSSNGYIENSTNVTVTVSKLSTNITLENETFELKVLDNISSGATLNPAGAGSLTYVSNNESVAIVENGVIKARGAGTALITVLFAGNDKYEAAEDKTIKVTVSKLSTNITLENETFELKVLDNISSGATLNPAGAGSLTYVSNNESVAIVENGVIKARGAGTALITVSFAGDDKYEAAEDKTITVTVTARDASVSVNNSTLDLKINDTFAIVATTSPEGLNVTYVVDDSGVVSVDENGVVTALKVGTATIIVKVGGDGYYAENSTNISVTVRSNVNPPVFTLSKNKNVVALYSAKANYKVLVSKDGKAVGAGETVTFKYNGKTYNVKTDKNGYATLKLNTKVKVKKYTITATYKGAKATNKVTIKNIIKAKNKKVKKSKKVTKVKVSLKKVNGKYLKNKKLKIKFNKKTYKVKTNKKGVAKWKVKKSMLKKLKVGKKYKYRVTYGKDIVTKKLTIRK